MHSLTPFLKYSFSQFFGLQWFSMSFLSLQVCPTQTDIFRKERKKKKDPFRTRFGTQLFKEDNYKRVAHAKLNCSVSCHLHQIADHILSLFWVPFCFSSLFYFVLMCLFFSYLCLFVDDSDMILFGKASAEFVFFPVMIFFALKKKSFLIDVAFQNRRRKWKRKMDGHL
jgi:hypothetical protein